MTFYLPFRYPFPQWWQTLLAAAKTTPVLRGRRKYVYFVRSSSHYGQDQTGDCVLGGGLVPPLMGIGVEVADERTEVTGSGT